MSENTKIEWTTHTFNPWMGCAKVHTGCKHCYAENYADTRFSRSKWGENGTRIRTTKENWRKPLKWNRDAAEVGERHRVFCASLADIFEDRPDLVDWRRELFEIIDDTPQLDWQLLTKRPENIISLWPDSGFRPNVWLGTSVSDQATADDWTARLVRNRHLSPILFLSVEPLVAPTVLTELETIDWVIVGGENKQPPERPCKNEWIRAIVTQCRGAEVPVFVKQLGTRSDLRDRKGGNMAEWPADLRVRELPSSDRKVSDGR